MAEQEMAGEDAALDAATNRIMGLGLSNLIQDESKLDRLEQTSGEIDLNEATGETDLQLLEQQQDAAAETKQDAQEGKGDGEDADAGEETAQFIELPSAEDGKDGERVPLAEAVEAVQFKRQFDGDVQRAVIKAEEEAYGKQDVITQSLAQTLDDVRQQGQAMLAAMRGYLPQAPDPIMLDRNSGYYNPEEYHLAKMRHDEFVNTYNQFHAKLTKTETDRKTVGDVTQSEAVRREQERTARYIPEFKDEKTRGEYKARLVDVLGKKFGVTQADLDDFYDHKAWRVMDYAYKQLSAEQKAPEVRKAVQEKAPKLVNGRPPASRDAQTGRFVNEARGELKKSGSEDAFVNFLLAGKRTPARR